MEKISARDKRILLIISLVALAIPLTTFGIKSISDLRSKAEFTGANCTSNSCTITWGHYEFAVALVDNGVLVSNPPPWSGRATSTTFNGLTPNKTYTVVLCNPNCGTGTVVRQQNKQANGSGVLTENWGYTVTLDGKIASTGGTSVVFSGVLQPSTTYNGKICALDCSIKVLETFTATTQ